MVFYNLIDVDLLAESQVKKKVSELDGDPYGLMNISVQNGIRKCTRL